MITGNPIRKTPRTYLADRDALLDKAMAIAYSGNRNEKLMKQAKAIINRIDRTINVLEAIRTLLSIYLRAGGKSRKK